MTPFLDEGFIGEPGIVTANQASLLRATPRLTLPFIPAAPQKPAGFPLCYNKPRTIPAKANKKREGKNNV
jgi:hypothetical protein